MFVPCFILIRQISVKPVPLFETLCPTAFFLPSHVKSWFLWTPFQNVYCIGTHKASHHHPPPPAGLYIFSQFPPDPDSSWCWGLGGSSLLLRGAQPKGGQGFFFFFWKRSKVRFSFFGLLYFVWANPTMVWSVPCVVCVPPVVFSAPLTLETTSVALHLMDSPHGCAYFTEVSTTVPCIFHFEIYF